MNKVSFFAGQYSGSSFFDIRRSLIIHQTGCDDDFVLFV